MSDPYIIHFNQQVHVVLLRPKLNLLSWLKFRLKLCVHSVQYEQTTYTSYTPGHLPTKSEVQRQRLFIGQRGGKGVGGCSTLHCSILTIFLQCSYLTEYIHKIKTSGLLANFQQYKKAFKSAISRHHASRLLCSIYQLIS